MIHLTVSFRALVFVLLLGVALFAGTDVARGAPALADLTLDGNLVFTGPNQGGAKDIRTSNTDGGLRIYNGATLSPVPTGAAIQFFGNGSSSYPGQAYIDSGANNNAALIFRTAGTGQAITERMRVTATGNVGIGTTNPQEQLELTGNLRLPATTATTGIIRSGGNTLLHTFGDSNFFAGINAGNLTMAGDFNTGVGFQALLNNTEGNTNTATGRSALQQNTSGFANTATGNVALQNNTTGTKNTAAGDGALSANTTGSNNTATGREALQGNTTGSNNTALGVNAGGEVIGTSNTTGSNNTFIGFQANAPSPGNLTNATAVGANASVSASNSLVLGGTGADAVSVGIGTTAPASTLQVATGYIQIRAVTGAAPDAADCNDPSEAGRMVVRTDGTINLYICSGTAWIGK